MFNKIKRYIKDNYKTIVYFALLYILFMWPVDYYITTGGGIMKIGNRIVVEDGYKSKGSFNLAYVSQTKGTFATYALSYIIPSWEREKVSEYAYDDNETKKDIEFRGKIDLLQSSDNAIKNAFLEANKTYKVTENKIYIYYVDEDSKSNLKVGDQIIAIDNQEVSNINKFQELLQNYNIDDTVKIKVKRNNKEKDIDAVFYEKEERKILGIYVVEIHKYKTYPKVKIAFKSGESGPSGGLTEALDVYNKITKKDLTKGLKIVATGEIESDGAIKSIGGVEYKLLGAAKKKADIFIVPNGENYKKCMKIAKKKKLKIKIIGVSTFKEAIKKLENM